MCIAIKESGGAYDLSEYFPDLHEINQKAKCNKCEVNIVFNKQISVRELTLVWGWRRREYKAQCTCVGVGGGAYLSVTQGAPVQQEQEVLYNIQIRIQVYGTKT